MPHADWFASSLLRSSPADYLRERQRLLAVSHAHPDEMTTLSAQGARFGDLELRWTAFQSTREPDEMPSSDRFLLMDSVALLHQTAETIWLWFLAAAAEDPAPWFAIPSTGPRQLKNAIDKFTARDAAETARLISIAFFGTNEAATAPGRPKEAEWRSAIDAIRSLLSWFAGYVQENAAYNALKHGSIGAAGRFRMTLDMDDRTIDWASGQTLTVLRTTPGKAADPPWWRLEQRWYSPEVSMAGISFGCTMLDFLWAMMRHRILGARQPQPEYGTIARHTAARLQDIDGSHGASRSQRVRFVPPEE